MTCTETMNLVCWTIVSIASRRAVSFTYFSIRDRRTFVGAIVLSKFTIKALPPFMVASMEKTDTNRAKLFYTFPVHISSRALVFQFIMEIYKLTIIFCRTRIHIIFINTVCFVCLWCGTKHWLSMYWILYASEKLSRALPMNT